MQLFVGVDIGGTNTKLGLVRNGRLTGDETSVPTISETPGRTDRPSRYLDLLAAEIRRAVLDGGFRLQDVAGVGIGVPGKVDNRAGIVHDATNLGWLNVKLAGEMTARLGIPVYADHDLRTIARGELYAGAGQGKKDILCVAMGTGIAAASVTDGRVVQGADYCAGEIGHDAVRGNTAVCACGKVGCLETIASAIGISRLADEMLRQDRLSALAEAPRPVTPYQVHQACEAGDEDAIGLFRFVAETLGEKLATVIALLNPELIVIGGGLSRSEAFLLAPLRTYLYGQFPHYRAYMQIVGSTLGDSAGILGAAHHAAERLAAAGT
ncbi:ROK family protein [Cohnella pontilimi]|uniref:ROK family protein n=1 Tax=Cohnella pontilimi TaxID=2564100 RepID=A0A4U0FHX0_9BACL|nr:ROK family protein [Cohnella pontilimi]TJY44044.1 ROK family protein [Cohnella pontilimi]